MKYLFVILGGALLYTLYATMYNHTQGQKSIERLEAQSANKPLPHMPGNKLPNPILNVIKSVGYLSIDGNWFHD